ncbi:hypothetical protein C8R47DRAFT_1200350 [Mycena vitilis]|nr:hypothetical protein C8R47DRAFT_1200350 [Mycena vitilis]
MDRCVLVPTHGGGFQPFRGNVWDTPLSPLSPLVLPPPMSAICPAKRLRILWTPPPASCTFLNMPSDLLELIVIESTEDYFDAPVQFIRHRTNVLLSCRWLHAIVDECAAMWSSYVLSQNMEKAELREMSRHFRDRTLQLKLYFFRSISPLPFPRKNPASLEEVLAFFLRHAHQCSMVYLTLDSYPQWMQVFNAFSSAHYPRLKSITFDWSGENLPTRLLQTCISELPFTGTSLQTVTCFRSFDMRLDWDHIPRFSSLTVLVLQFLFSDYPPTGSQLAAILASCPMLRQLSMRLLVKSSPLSASSPPIVFDHLHELDLDLDGHGITPSYIQRWHFPLLEVMSFDLNRAEDFSLFVEFAARSPNLSRLILSGHLCDESRTLDVLRAVPTVTNLDLSCINGIMFKNSLARMVEGSDVACPKLRTLTVIEYSAAELRSLVDARHAQQAPLDVVNCHHLFPTSLTTYSSYLNYLMDMQYVREQLQKLNVDPEEDEWSQDWFGR